MRQKLQQALVGTAAPVLWAGERPEVASRARVGMSMTANLARAAASAIVSGGNTVRMINNKQVYVLLTDRRLLLLESHWLTFRPVAKVLAELPRRSMMVSDVDRGFMTSCTLSAAGHPEAIRLSFARTERGESEALLRALGVPA